ncbi:hypothetical protein S7711_10652 [Stachybotrys chartarum IBT 7711]|uniref:Uncharacterized protein n=1 Tax=Stachybotrys chartarum (strain CBS 109288 / IBT 7711) TaxID=1280523 RepID=A0A084B2H4_STACB|nr:hypothetical protein S7711_10652 [Stachybotrys chartarum IBT 7711]KFA56018.1 hypothetical protein S40293_10764 [Stachybotrys chartarum IBT 40293]
MGLPSDHCSLDSSISHWGAGTFSIDMAIAIESADVLDCDGSFASELTWSNLAIEAVTDGKFTFRIHFSRCAGEYSIKSRSTSLPMTSH